LEMEPSEEGREAVEDWTCVSAYREEKMRPRFCETGTHIDTISVSVYPHAVYNRVETTA